MPGVVAVFTADDLRIAPQPPSGNVEGASGTLVGPVLPRGARPRRRPLRRRAGRGGHRRLARARPGRGGGRVAGGRPARRGDRRGGRGRRRRAAAVPGPRLERRARVRAGLGRGRAGGRRRRRARAVRAAARWPRCRWRRTRSPWFPRTTAATRSGSRRRCRSTSATTWRICSEVDKKRVRIVAPDVGGGFGAKLIVYPEFAVVAAAAKALGRPVRWAETRSESMLT